MPDLDQNPTSAPYPNPSGDSVYNAKVLGQSSTVRQEISRYSSENLGLQIYSSDKLADPDAGSLRVTCFSRTDFDDNTVDDGNDVSDQLIKEDVGVYSFRLSPSLTEARGLLTVHWEYRLEGEEYDYWDYYQIIEPMPIYDTLPEGERGIVKMVSMMFEDLYDSTEGGPHLKEEWQTHYGTERIAMCLRLATNRINIQSQPWTSYIVGDGQVGGPRFPANAYSILMFATYLEVVNHLIRSYIEQPVVSGSAGVTYDDRRDYVDRWRQVMLDEKDNLDKAIRNFKRSTMGLGGGNLIVSGGIFGYNSRFQPGGFSAAARGMRFYPMTFIGRV